MVPTATSDGARQLVVVGTGPGIGRSLARRYGREGYQVALVARDPEGLARLGAELHAEGVTAGWAAVDVTDASALSAAVTRFAEHAGRIDVLHFNPSAFREADPLALSVEDLLADVRLGVGALLPAVQAARPAMPAGGRVTVTGSMAADQPWHRAASLGVQKAALRNLVRSLDTTLAEHGVRAVSVTVAGTLTTEDGPFHPDRVAETLYAAAQRPDDGWTSEVRHPEGER